jgi:hypothetical protein
MDTNEWETVRVSSVISRKPISAQTYNLEILCILQPARSFLPTASYLGFNYQQPHESRAALHIFATYGTSRGKCVSSATCRLLVPRRRLNGLLCDRMTRIDGPIIR